MSHTNSFLTTILWLLFLFSEIDITGYTYKIGPIITSEPKPVNVLLQDAFTLFVNSPIDL